MTYVTEQTSAELRQHMKRLKAMRGWGDPLADRLWKEIQEQDERIERLKSAIEFAHFEGFQWPSDPMAEFATVALKE